MNDIAQFKNAALLIDPTTPPDQCAALLDKLAAFMAAAKEMKAAVDDRIVEYIKETGNDITIGPRRWYVGTEKKTKCQDKAAALMALIEHTGGDFGKVAELMAAEPFKYGAVRGELPADVYARLFVTIEVEELKEGKAKGQPKEKLLIADERFKSHSQR